MRKVRTSGGSRYYGLPIGAPITADAIAKAKQKHGGIDAPAPTRANAKTTKAVMDAPKPKAPNVLQRFNRKVQTGKSKPTNADTEKARADELTATGTKGGTVSVGERVYDVPAGVSLHPSPTGGPNVYAVSPDESVRILTPSGIVDLDDDMSDQIMDRIYPSPLSPEDKAAVYKQKVSDADLGGDAEAEKWLAAHPEWSPNHAENKKRAAESAVKAEEWSKSLTDESQTPEQKAAIYSQQVKNADLAGDRAAGEWVDAHPDWSKNFAADQAAAEKKPAEREKYQYGGDSPKKTPTKAQQEWDREADSDFGVSTPRPDKGYGDDMSDSDLEFYSKPTGPDDRRTPSQRKYDHAADSDFGMDGKQQRPDEGLGDQAPEEPKRQAPPADKGPADPSKPLGNGNWDATSMGRSVAAPDPGEVAAMQASPYTSKYLDENGNLTPERIAVHDAIIASFLEGLEAQENPTQFMNGGGPASGKGTMTKGKNAELTNYPSSRRVNDEDPDGGFEEFTGDKPGALLIDPDAIKMQLPEVKEARGRQAKGEGTEDDKQWAGSSHEESSQLAKRLHRAALERGYNVIYDGTGNSSANSVRSKVRAARDLGYRVEANYLYLEPQEGISRAKIRADRANRIVPASQITGTYAKLPEIFDELKEDGTFDKVNLFDNNVAYGEPANLIGSGDGRKFDIADPEAYQKYMSSRERTDSTRFVSAAQSALDGYSALEPQTTSMLNDLADQHGAELAGLNHRLKTPESMSRKMVDLAQNTGLTPEEAAPFVRDALRYTMRVPDESYVDTIDAVLEEFRQRNFEIDAKNTWAPGASYQGVNVTLTDPDTGKSFEVQFHTPESLRVKHDLNHAIYKKSRTMKANSAERAALEAEMVANLKDVAIPDGIQGRQF